MSTKHIIKVGAPSHIELIVDFEAPKLKLNEAIKRLQKLGNPILGVEGNKIRAVQQIEKITYDHSVATQGELVWACDFCNAYSKTRQIVESHEKVCNNNPKRS